MPAAPYHTAVRRHPSREVFEMLLRLRPIFRKTEWDVLALRHRDELKTAEIATTLDISPAAVRGRERRAWKKVEAEWQKRSGLKRDKA